MPRYYAGKARARGQLGSGSGVRRSRARAMEPESTNQARVVCAGILVADHVCTPMERLPAAGHLVAVDRMFLLTGGCAANVAVNIARQGITVRTLGRVGRDAFGDFIRDDLRRLGVDTGGIAVSEQEPSSQTMILLCRGEDRRFVHTFGANREFVVSDISEASLEGAEVLYVGGYLVLPGFNPAELASRFADCRRRGMRTVLDVVIPTGFESSGELDAVLPHTDIFLPNNDEAEILTGEIDPVRQAKALLDRGVGTVVITLGSDGLLFSDGGEFWRAGHFPVEVIDQTGAGDAFCAGLISGLVEGMSLAAAIHYGSALGMSCVRSIGCYQGVFTAAEARVFLRENPLEIVRA